MKYYLINDMDERVAELSKEQTELHLGEKSVSSLEDILNRACTQNETGTSLDRKGVERIIVKKLKQLHRKGESTTQNDFGFFYYCVKGNSKQRLTRQEAVALAGKSAVMEFGNEVKPKKTTQYIYNNIEFALMDKPLKQAV